MLYLANPSTPSVRDAMSAGLLGMIATPLQGNRRPTFVTWCADNGCFSDKWDEGHWWGWLSDLDPASCLFAVAPDVVADWSATLTLSSRWFSKIRGLGYPVAIVLQDGLEDPDEVPWDDVDAVFTGGSTEFKLSLTARRVVQEARRRGKWCHMGRVNTLRRLRLAARDGYDSVDGTYLAFGPDTNLPKLLRYLASVDRQPAMGLGQ